VVTLNGSDLAFDDFTYNCHNSGYSGEGDTLAPRADCSGTVNQEKLVFAEQTSSPFHIS
jgi:hypothetical protein